MKKWRFSVLALLLFSMVGGAMAQSWTTSTADMPTSRYQFTSSVGLNGDIYVFGGRDSNFDPVSTVEKYDPDTDSWSTVTSMPTSRYQLTSSVGPNGDIYVIGGRDSNGAVGTVEKYDPDTDSWSTVTSMPTSRRFLTSSVGPNGDIYVIGGRDSNFDPVSTVEKYDPDTDSWSTVTSMPTSRYYLTSSVGPNGDIYVFGGRDSNSDTVSTVEKYDPDTDSWSTVTSMPTSRYYLTSSVSPNGDIYVIGGEDNGNVLSTVEKYDPDTDSWSTVTSMPTSRYALTSSVGPDRSIYAIGGVDSNGNVLSTVESLVFNSPPVFDSAVVEPDPPLIGDALDVSASASDPDGSVQSLEVEIFQDGTSVFSSSTSSGSLDINDAYTVQEGTVKVEFTATDDAGATTTQTLTRTLTDTKPVVNISGRSGTVFDYDQSFSVNTQNDGDDNPSENLSCRLDLDGSQIDQRTVTEGDSYTVNTRSDLGSHSVNVTCTEQDDQQSDTGSTSFTVENFKFQSLSGASSGKETTQQSFNAGFKAGDMVNNVSFDLVYDSQIRDQATVNVSGVTDSSQGFSHVLNLAQTDGLNRDYNVSAEVDYDNLNSGTSTDNVDSSTNSQTVNQAFSYKDSVFEDGLTQVPKTLQFETRDEINNSLLDANVEAGITVNNPDQPDKTRFFGFDFSKDKKHELYLAPSDATVTANVFDKRSIAYENLDAGFPKRRHYLTDTTLDNETTNINLYMLDQTKGSTVRLELTNSDLQGLSNHLIRVERAFPDQNETRTVQLAKTGTEGFTSTFLQLQERYIFTVFDENGDLVDQVGPETVTTTDKRIQVNDGIDPSLANVLNEVQFTDIQRENQSLSVSYVSETRRLNNLFLKISSDGLFATKTLDVDSSEQPQGQLEVTDFNATQALISIAALAAVLIWRMSSQ